MIGKRSDFGIKHDLVFWVSIAAAAVFFLVAIGLIVARPVLLDRIVVVISNSYSPDGFIEQGTINTLESVLVKLAPVALLIGCFIFCYGFLWRYFSSRLISERSEAPDSLPSSSVAYFEVYCLIIAMIVALILRVHDINRGLSYDELLTTIHFVNADSLLGWKNISTGLALNNHIAYSILARFSQAIFGSHEWALRVPALLLGLISISCFWVYTRSLLGPKLAIIAAFVLAIFPPHVKWSASARGYTGMVLFTIISNYLYFKLLKRPTYRDAFKYILASVCGMCFHLYFGFVIAVQIVFVLYLATRQVFARLSLFVLNKKSFRLIWISFAAMVIISLCCYGLVLPLVVFNIIGGGRGGVFYPSFPLKVVEGMSGMTWAPLVVLLFLLFVSGLISLRRLYPKEVTYFTVLFLLPVLIIWTVRPLFYCTRFLAFLLPYYILFIISGFSFFWNSSTKCRIRIYRFLFHLAGAIFAIMCIYIWSTNSWQNIRDAGVRDSVRAMESDAGKLSALCAISNGAELFQYYTDRQIIVPNSMEEFEEIIKKHPETRCAFFSSMRIVPRHKEIYDFLAQNAESKKFGKVVVFIYRP